MGKGAMAVTDSLKEYHAQTVAPYTPTSLLLTGGTGFIGSHVAVRLAKTFPDAKIIVIDRMDYVSSVRNLEDDDGVVSSNLKFVRGDIRAVDLVEHVLVTENVDTVMHFAAQSHVDNSFLNSVTFTEHNVLGTHYLLEACRVYGGIRKFVYVSTDEVYGETMNPSMADAGVTEESVLAPTNPYAAAKAGGEMQVKAYMDSYKLPCLMTRGNNVYGPGQFPEKVIPKFIMLASQGRSLPLHGGGHSRRSFLFVKDVAEAFETVLVHGVIGETYNIGSPKERTVRETAADILAVMKGGEVGSMSSDAASDKLEIVQDRLFNDRRYYIDNSKLEQLGWTEKTSWAEGLKRTIEWYTGKGSDDRLAHRWSERAMAEALDPHPQSHPTGGLRSLRVTYSGTPLNELAPAEPDDKDAPYEPRSLLLTGGTGFIGSHVAVRLAKTFPDAKIIVIDRMDYVSSVRNLEDDDGVVSSNLKFVRGDIRAVDLVEHVLVTENVDTVMHFAAQSHVDNSFLNSVTFTEHNVLGTHYLLEACRVYGGIRKFVYVSTDEVYGETMNPSMADAGVTEESVLAPTNPYAAAKAGGEMQVKAYMDSYKLPCLMTRGNNVYGPGQFPEKVIPKFIMLASQGRSLPLHGGGHSRRSFLFVKDVAEAFETVLVHGVIGETYNIGSPKERTVRETAADILAVMKGGEVGSMSSDAASDKLEIVQDRLFNDRRYYIDNSKLEQLGWTEKTSWAEGLKRTIEWYTGKGSDDRLAHRWSERAMAEALNPHPTTPAGFKSS